MKLVPPEPHVPPPGSAQPGAAGPTPGLQIPSLSNPKRTDPGTDKGMCEIGLDELLTTPINESSEFSYGPWLGSPWTTLPLLVTVIRNWHPELAPTGGHCENITGGRTVAVWKWVTGVPSRQPGTVMVTLNVPLAGYVWEPLTESGLPALYVPGVGVGGVPQSIVGVPGVGVVQPGLSTTPENCWPAIAVKSAWAAAALISITNATR